ncbi:HipA domain-containing protein [Runella zeae]|uniref:HipA domain-containing protein n=1 Tax=Runella zeae TaxID=94255 RepID=UPI0004195030|nr:HipA domain-containing protein [Runella zeae]
MNQRCLYCYEPLSEQEQGFHTKCCKKFFGTTIPPTLNLGTDDLREMARRLIIRSVAVTGVQPKLSLDLEKVNAQTSRLTVVGLWGSYILKPPTDLFELLPENEDLTMKLAALCGLKTAEHTLIRLQSGKLAYLTKRFDRQKNGKIHVEDLCQLTENLTEHKYRGSIERVGKTIRTYTTNKGLEALALFELVVFCFITSNADMHLKNFSLIRFDNGEVALSPAYDLVSTKLAMPEDLEESALTINGKKNRLKRGDFDELATKLGIPAKSSERVYAKFVKKQTAMLGLIEQSFLSDEMKAEYAKLLIKRIEMLNV